MGTISRVSIHAFVSSIDRRRRARRRAVLCLVYGDKRSSARADIGHGQSEPDRSAALSARAGKACGRCRRETACRGRQARHRRAEAGARRGETGNRAGQARGGGGEVGCRGRQACHRRAEAGPRRGETNGCAGQARSGRGEVGCHGRQACHRRAEAGRPGREACGRRAEAGACRGKTSGCAREARLEAEVCRQAIRKRCPQQRGRAQ